MILRSYRSLSLSLFSLCRCRYPECLRLCRPCALLHVRPANLTQRELRLDDLGVRARRLLHRATDQKMHLGSVLRIPRHTVRSRRRKEHSPYLLTPTDDESFFLRACAETMERPRFLVSAMWLESTSGSNKPIPHLSDCFRSGLSDADTLHERPESGPLNSFRTGSDGFGSGIFPCPFHSLAAEDRRCVFRLTRSGSIFVISRGVSRYHSPCRWQTRHRVCGAWRHGET